MYMDYLVVITKKESEYVGMYGLVVQETEDKITVELRDGRFTTGVMRAFEKTDVAIISKVNKPLKVEVKKESHKMPVKKSEVVDILNTIPIVDCEMDGDNVLFIYISDKAENICKLEKIGLSRKEIINAIVLSEESNDNSYVDLNQLVWDKVDWFDGVKFYCKVTKKKETIGEFLVEKLSPSHLKSLIEMNEVYKGPNFHEVIGIEVLKAVAYQNVHLSFIESIYRDNSTLLTIGENFGSPMLSNKFYYYGDLVKNSFEITPFNKVELSYKSYREFLGFNEVIRVAFNRDLMNKDKYIESSKAVANHIGEVAMEQYNLMK